MIEIVRTPGALRQHTGQWRCRGLRSALVPTMGALHDGHIALVRAGLERADRLVASIFVNPKQFGPSEDLARYPREEENDLAKLERAGAHLVYVPDASAMYPQGFATTVQLAGPAKAGLEDRFRPHFFAGVATVVAKLFIPAQCDFAMFGEKDYQQLKVVTRMAQDLDIMTQVIGVATLRESDGLAMSSRNRYLSPEERTKAATIYRTLSVAAEKIRGGAKPGSATAAAARSLTREGFKVDYIAARHAETLAPIASPSDPIRLLAAAWLGKTRLIDNIGIPPLPAL